MADRRRTPIRDHSPLERHDRQRQREGQGSDLAKRKRLVVTRLSPGGTCQIGYVDTHANADANELARKLADDHAREFHCGKDKPIVLGKTDPDLAMPKGDGD